MKSLRVTMPDGNKYDVPVDLIATNRARYYAELESRTTYGPRFDSAFKKEYEYTMANNDEIIDWAANNMNWSDVSNFSKKVGDKTLSPEDFQEGWINGDKEIVE